MLKSARDQRKEAARRKAIVDSRLRRYSMTLFITSVYVGIGWGPPS
jgi:hypothetical protein